MNFDAAEIDCNLVVAASSYMRILVHNWDSYPDDARHYRLCSADETESTFTAYSDSFMKLCWISNQNQPITC